MSSVNKTAFQPIGTPLYLLNYINITGKVNDNMFDDNKQIAVKLIPGPHTRDNNEQSFTNPVKPGMKITWPSNTSTPATVVWFFVGESNPDSIIRNVIYITLDKPVDPTATIFYLTNAEGFRNNVPASVITDGIPTYSNMSSATQQAREFKLGQLAVSKQVQNTWLF